MYRGAPLQRYVEDSTPHVRRLSVTRRNSTCLLHTLFFFGSGPIPRRFNRAELLFSRVIGTCNCKCAAWTTVYIPASHEIPPRTNSRWALRYRRRLWVTFAHCDIKDVATEDLGCSTPRGSITNSPQAGPRPFLCPF
jgi:hypothetical protein